MMKRKLKAREAKNCKAPLAITMRRRGKEIALAARIEMTFVLGVVCDDLEGEMDQHDCERLIRPRCERAALSLPNNWSKLFPRHCRAFLAQNAPFQAEPLQAGREVMGDVSSVATLLIALRRTVSNSASGGPRA